MSAGTLGAIVFDITTCQPLILSNRRVVAGASDAAAGEPVAQPGRVDGARVPGDAVATPTRMELDSRMEAAVATLNGTRPYCRDMLGLGTISGAEPAVLEMSLVKSGRRTGSTDVEISRGGDSASVWMNESTNKASGLHFAGETDPASASPVISATPVSRCVRPRPHSSSSKR
ncbi:MAG: hypothetical protein ACKVIQ_19725 [Acidimicrobiales bacterium]|jgi:hypothetical protein